MAKALTVGIVGIGSIAGGLCRRGGPQRMPLLRRFIEKFTAAGEQRPEQRAALLQRRPAARIHHPPLVEHHDAVGEVEGRAAAGDHQQHMVVVGVAPERGVDLRLGTGVHRRSTVVEDQDLRGGEQRAGQRQALALAAGKIRRPLRQSGIEAVRQRHDEAGGPGRIGGGADRLPAGAGMAVGDVIRHRTGKQKGIFKHRADAAAQVAQRQVGDVLPAPIGFEPQRAGGRVVKAGEQHQQGRLAGTRGADDGHRLAGLHRERYVVQHLRAAGVAEADAVEAQPGYPALHRLAPVLQRRLGVDQRKDPLHRGAGALDDHQV